MQGLTYGVGLSVLCRHHERSFAQRVHGVHLSAVTQQKLQTRQVICECCGVQRSPAMDMTRINKLLSHRNIQRERERET